MRKRRNWLKTSIAMLTLVATVLETGFTSVSTLAAEITTEDGIVVNNDAVEEANVESEAPSNDGLTINVEPENDPVVEETTENNGDDFAVEPAEVSSDSEFSEDTAPAAEETFEEAEELKEGTLDVTDSGISGSGYDEISIYVNTEKLSYRKSFRIEFTGPDNAMYPTVINDTLYKTNDGRYDFDNLEGSDFTVRATSEDKVILSYRYNQDGYPEIVVENEPVEKVLNKKTVSFEDGTEVAAITGEGFESLKLSFNTEELSDKASYKLVVDTDAKATVDGEDATKGIKGLDNRLQSLVIENLEEEPFTAYILSDNDELKIQTVANIENTEDGEATFTVDNLDVKRVYEYEDAKVKVTATLEKADAVPDDAFFCVAPLSEEEAARYLSVLNSEKEEGAEEYTADNTLLYDISFYKDDSKTEKIEPEEGSVTLNVQFKKNQLEEDLGASEATDVEVTHFVEEGSRIETEQLAVADNASVDELEVATDSFSTFAFTVKGNSLTIDADDLNAPGTDTTESVLGQAWYYGITANTLNLKGDAETSFAVKKFVTDGGGTQCGVEAASKAGNSTCQYDILAEVEHKNNYQFKGFKTILTIPESLSGKFHHEKGSDYLIEQLIRGSNAVAQVKNTVKGYIDFVATSTADRTATSALLMNQDSIKDYDNLPKPKDNNGNDMEDRELTIDIRDASAGTYYISMDKYPQIIKALGEAEKLKIYKKNDQVLVFNYNGTAALDLYKFNVNDKGTDSLADIGSTTDPEVEGLIFNMPNITELTFKGAVIGTFIAPKASIYVKGTSAGWLIGDTVNVEEGEWHFTNGRVPDPTPTETELRIPVTKHFYGGEGKWEGGFEFKLEELKDGDWKTNAYQRRYPSNPNVDIDAFGDEVWVSVPGVDNLFLDGGDRDKADGEFVIKYDKETLSKLSFGPGYRTPYNGIFPDVTEKWYRVTEIPTGRSDIEENIIEPATVSANSGRVYKNRKYWYIHAFIYRREYKGTYIYLPTDNTARVYPNDWFNKNDSLVCNEKDPIVFKNRYIPPVELEGEKTIDGEDPGNATFDFTLYNFSDDMNVGFSVENQTKSNVGKTIKFDPLQYNLSDCTWSRNNEYYYYYMIRETTVSDTYTIDPSVYVVKCTLKAENGKYTYNTPQYYKFQDLATLNALMKANTHKKDVNGTSTTVYDIEKLLGKSQEALTTIAGKNAFGFDNKVNDAEGEVPVYGTKLLENRDPNNKDKFTFKIEAVEYNGYKDTHNNLPKTVTVSKKDFDNNGLANVVLFKNLDVLKYTYAVDKGKEYHYKITEIVPSATDDAYDANLTYANNEINVKVNIGTDFKKNGNEYVKVNGKYQLDITSENNINWQFKNTYSTEKNLKFVATKDYEEDCSLENSKEFTFVLKQSIDGQSYTEVSGIGRATGSKAQRAEFVNTKGNTVEFALDDELKSGATKTFYYSIEEDHGSAVYDAELNKYVDTNGVAYDPDILYVTVNVKYNKQSGEIEITKSGKYVNQETGKDDTSRTFDPNEAGYVTAAFKNDYKPLPVAGIVEGTKELTGRVLEDDNQEFEFTLKADTKDTETAAAVADGTLVVPVVPAGGEGYTVHNTGKKIVFGNPAKPNDATDPANIVFKKAGTFKFTVSEKKGDNKKMFYSEELYTAKITVSRVGGALVVGKPEYTLNGKDSGTMTFHNDEFGDGEITFHAVKKVLLQKEDGTYDDNNFEYPDAGKFKFDLYEKVGDKETKIEGDVPNKAEGLVDFTTIHFFNNDDANATGNDKKALGLVEGGSTKFTYVIREQIPDGAEEDKNYATNGLKWKNGISYSEQPTEITVTVTLKRNDQNKLVLEAVANPDTTRERIAFKNKSIPQETYWGIDGTKELVGERVFDRNADKFYADLYECDSFSDADIAKAKNGTPADTVPIVITGDREAEFNFGDAKVTYDRTDHRRKYTKPGVHHYMITESGGSDRKDVNNDDIMYLVTVTVTSVNGALVANEDIKYIRKIGDTPSGDVDNLHFVNKVVSPATATIEAFKTLKGQKLKKEMFYFTLQEFGTTGNKSVTLPNTDSGEIAFAPDKNGYCGDVRLKYTLEDVKKSPFMYTIIEEVKDGSYTLDSHVFGAMVTLTETETDEVDANGVKTGKKIQTVKPDVSYYKFADTITKDNMSSIPSDPAEWEKVEKPAKVEFVNEYHAYGELALPALKIVKGGKPNDTQTFKFTLQEKKINRTTGLQSLEDVTYTEVYDKDEAGHRKGDVKEPANTITVGQAETEPGKYEEKGGILTEKTYEAKTAFARIQYSAADLDAENSWVEDGKYVKYYVMKEVNEHSTYPWISYDQTTYTIRVELKVSNSGEITPVYTFSTDEVDPTEDNFFQKIQHWVTRDLFETYVPRFTNTYTAKGSLKLSVKKTLVGLDLSKNDYSFVLVKDGDKGNPITKSTKDFTKAADGTVTVQFDEIEYDKIGNHKYTISEVVPDEARKNGGVLDGVTYDLGEYTIDVTVSDNGYGQLVVAAETSRNPDNDDWPQNCTSVTVDVLDADGNPTGETTLGPCNVQVDYTNTYKPDELSIQFGGMKSISGRDLDEGDVFSFKLTGKGEVNKSFAEQTVKSIAGKQADSGAFTFAPIKFTAEDLETKDANGNIAYLPYKTFKYEIRELDANGKDQGTTPFVDPKTGLTYNNTVYTVTVVVFCNSGELTATVFKGDIDGDKFANKEESYTNYIVPAKTVGNDKDGYYELFTSVADVENTYSAEGEIVIPAKKELVGGNKEDTFTFLLAEDENFSNIVSTVTVTGKGESKDFLAKGLDPNDPSKGHYTRKFEFGDKGKSFTYYIKEDVPKVGDPDYKDYYTYSNTVYKVDFTVEDNGKGTLVATKPVYTVITPDNLTYLENGSEVAYKENEVYKETTVKFINEYDASGTITLKGKKQLNVNIDGEDKDILTINPNYDQFDQFKFGLYKSDASGNKGELIADTTCNKTTGEFEFNFKELTKDGQKVEPIIYGIKDVGVPQYFKIVEIPPADYKPDSKIGMKYDETEFQIIVTIKDSAKDGEKKGELEVTAVSPQMTDIKLAPAKTMTWIQKLFGGNNEKLPYHVLIINDYDSVGIIDPPVLTKTILGKEKIEPGEFEFRITGSYEGTLDDLISKGTLTKNDKQKDQEKDYTIFNGINPKPKSERYKYRHYVENPITGEVLVDEELKPGELFVGDVMYRYQDMLKSGKVDDDGNLYDDFVYMAEEVEPSTAQNGVTYSKAVLYLFVHAVDKKNGVIETTDPITGSTTLIWRVLERNDDGSLKKGNDGKYILREVTKDDLTLGFVNKFYTSTFVDIPGKKELIGREWTDDDVFEFTITDVKSGESVTVNNTQDMENGGKLTAIDFSHDKAGFLNFEWGYKEKAGTDPVEYDTLPDPSGEYEYRIEEKPFVVDGKLTDTKDGVTRDTRYYIVTVKVESEKVVNSAGKIEYRLKKPVVKDVKRYFANGSHDDTYKYAPDAKVKFKFENPFEAFADIEFAGRKIVKNVGTDAEIKEDLTGKYGFELIDQVPNAAVGTGPVIASAYTDKDGNYVIKPKKEGKAHFFDQDDLKDVKDPYGEGKDYHFSIKEILPPNGKWVDDYHYEYGGVIYDTDTISITVNLHYDANNELIPEVKGISRAVVHGGGVMQYRPEDMKDLNYKNRIKGLDFTNKVRDYYKRGGKKIWRDSIANDLDHPDVTINLLRNGVKVATAVAKSPDWKYFFDKDQNGEPLPVCDVRGKAYDYTLEEVPIDGYDTSTRLNEDGSIDFINTKGDIMIKKINADTGSDLVGATLAIYDGSSKIEEWVSEIGAHVVTAKLTAGKTYTLKELKAPEGFELAADVSFVAPSDGGSVTVTMSDKPIVGSVELTKRDASTREALSGAEFELRKSDGTRIYGTGSAGSYTASTSTSNGIFAVDANGMLTISNLPYGTYYFLETKAPEGYELSTEQLGFSVVKSGELVRVTYLDRKATGSVRLRKVSSTGVGSLAGAEFELYAKTPRTAGQAAASTIFRDAYYRVDSYRTNSLGEIYVTDLPWDDYYFIEVKAPDGYELRKDVNGDDIVYTFSINAATARTTIDLGGITNDEIVPPPTPTPTPTGAVLGERVQRGGVVNGVLGVRAKPTSGVLGERVGPVTGDASNIILWLLLLVACAATIVATVLTGKKKKLAK